MSNKEKRAKRAKLKAKNSRIAKQKKNVNTSEESKQDIGLSSDAISFFRTLPPPESEAECLDKLENFLASREVGALGDLDDSALLFFHMYKEWYANNLGDDV